MYPQPTQTNHVEILASVLEGIKTSKTIRSTIKELVSSTNNIRIQAHEKVTTAISRSIENDKAHQVRQEIYYCKLNIHPVIYFDLETSLPRERAVEATAKLSLKTST